MQPPPSLLERQAPIRPSERPPSRGWHGRNWPMLTNWPTNARQCSPMTNTPTHITQRLDSDKGESRTTQLASAALPDEDTLMCRDGQGLASFELSLTPQKHSTVLACADTYTYVCRPFRFESCSINPSVWLLAAPAATCRQEDQLRRREREHPRHHGAIRASPICSGVWIQ